ncbi:EamA family transporter [Bacillaceae bacterium W0354]
MKLNKGIITVLIGAGCFGFTPVFAKMGFGFGYSLGQITIVQMVTSFLILWMITFFSKRSSFKGINKKNILPIMVTGCLVGLTSIFYYAALLYLPASLAIILMFQFVWIGIILDWIINKVRPAPVTILSIVLILIGVFFASNIVDGEIQALPVKGFVYGILSAFTYAGFIIFSGKVAVNVDPWTRTSIMVTGSMILVLILFMREVPSVLNFDTKLMTIALGASLFGAVLPPLFFAIGAPLISGSMANILTSFELPVAILSASIILSEIITPSQWLGTIIIILAIALNELGVNHANKRKLRQAS